MLHVHVYMCMHMHMHMPMHMCMYACTCTCMMLLFCLFVVRSSIMSLDDFLSTYLPSVLHTLLSMEFRTHTLSLVPFLRFQARWCNLSTFFVPELLCQ